MTAPPEPVAELVSVVVPTYQSAPFVRRTLDSVLAQTYPRLEVVIGDHASTDGTWELVQEYAADPRVRLLRTPAGGGAEHNWNRVTAAATGTYLKLVCADDLLRPTCVEQQVAAMREHPGVALVASRRDLVDVHDRPLLRGRGLPGLSGVVDGTRALRRLVRSGTNILGEPVCVLLRTEQVRRLGGWSAAQPYLIDQHLYARVLRLGDLYAIPASLAAFRVSNAQWSVALARSQAAQAHELHRWLHAECPATVSAADVWLGSARAARTALLRRAAYVAWRRRMRPSLRGRPTAAGPGR